MKLLCDEGVEREVVEALRIAGHEVAYVAEMRRGISDDEVLETASDGAALLITADKDFGEIVFRQRRAHAGVLLLRLHGLGGAEKGEAACRALDEHGERLVGGFSVLERGRLRIRGSQQPR